MMHALRTEAEIVEAEERIKAALRDAIRAHQSRLIDYYHSLQAECDVARENLIPKPRRGD